MQCDRQTWGLCGKGAMDTKGGARGWGGGVLSKSGVRESGRRPKEGDGGKREKAAVSG